MTQETTSSGAWKHILAHLFGLNEVIETPTRAYCAGCMWVKYR